MRVEDLMERGVVTVRSDATLREAALRMLKDDIGALPVVDAEGRVIGMLTDRDIVLRAVAHDFRASAATVDSVFSGGVHTIDAKADARQALLAMAGHKVRRLPVVDGERLVGIVSLSDFCVPSVLSDAASHAMRTVTTPGKPQTKTGINGVVQCR